MNNRSIAVVPLRTITAASDIIAGEVIPLSMLVDQLTFQCNFTYGSGGTSAKVYVQTTLDNGATWIDIACFAFATASLRKVMSLQAQSSVVAALTATDGTLTDDTAKDGIRGDRIRARMKTVGTYAGGTTIALAAMIN